MPDPAADAKRIIDANVYMTLATADADGRPWASPVWFAHDEHTRFVWVSRPERRHSQNLAERPQAGIVIFDSTAPEGAAEAVYVEAEAERVAEQDHRGLAPAGAPPALPRHRLGPLRARPERRSDPGGPRLALQGELRVGDRLEGHPVER